MMSWILIAVNQIPAYLLMGIPLVLTMIMLAVVFGVASRKLHVPFIRVIETILMIPLIYILLGKALTYVFDQLWYRQLMETIHVAMGQEDDFYLDMIIPVMMYVCIPILVISMAVWHWWQVKNWRAMLVSSLGILLSVGVLVSSSWGIFWLSSVCEARGFIFHEFNAHLLDVCRRDYNTPNQVNECPKKESELKAFNPKKFDSFSSCYRTKYWFDPTTGEYAWTTRQLGKPYIMVSHPAYQDGFRGFFLGTPDPSWDITLPTWPPPEPAPWSKLLPEPK